MKLTDSQEQFCEEYVGNGFKKGDAYIASFEQDDKDKALISACELLRNPKILDRIKEIEMDYRIVGHSIGIDKKLIMGRIKDQLSAKKAVFFAGKYAGEMDDNTSVNKAIEIYLKLVGDYTEKKEITIDDKDLSSIDVSKLNKGERAALKEQIEKEL